MADKLSISQLKRASEAPQVCYLLNGKGGGKVCFNEYGENPFIISSHAAVSKDPVIIGEEYRVNFSDKKVEIIADPVPIERLLETTPEGMAWTFFHRNGDSAHIPGPYPIELSPQLAGLADLPR